MGEETVLVCVCLDYSAIENGILDFLVLYQKYVHSNVFFFFSMGRFFLL